MRAKHTSARGSLETLIGEGRVIFGCGHLHKICRRSDRERLIRQALDGGVREFDAAPAYGNGVAERLLGDIVRDVGRDVIVNTKAGIPVSIYPSSHALAFSLYRVADLASCKHRRAYARRDFAPSSLERSLEDSLARLRLEAVNTFFLHEPLSPFEPAEWARVEATLNGLVRQGKARTWGIAGRVTRYHQRRGIAHVPVMQLPLSEVDEGARRPASGRQIGYSVFTAHRAARDVSGFENYVRKQAARYPDLSFVMATHDPARLATWTGTTT
jgi:aryl-alcohol dehydrogenase-like predicted oxidoreductase